MSKSPILEFLHIKTSNSHDKILCGIIWRNIMKEVDIMLEDNDIDMDIESWGGRGKNINKNSSCRIFTI